MAKFKVTTIKPRKKFTEIIDLKELWSYRDLFLMLVRRDLIIRYQQTLFGVGWVIFKPLFSASIFTIIFGIIFRFPSNALPYVVFVYSGLVFWNFFSSSISGASISLESADALIKKVYFPRIIVPLANIVTHLVDLGVSTAFLILFLIIYKVTPGAYAIPIFMLSTFMLILTVTGASLFLSALNVRYRDVKQLLPFFIQMFIFLTPVIYPIKIVPLQYRWILSYSPLSTSIEIFRAALSPGMILDYRSVIASMVVAFILLIFGIWFFAKSEWSFADIV